MLSYMRNHATVVIQLYSVITITVFLVKESLKKVDGSTQEAKGATELSLSLPGVTNK